MVIVLCKPTCLECYRRVKYEAYRPNHRWGETETQRVCWECRAKEFPRLQNIRKGYSGETKDFLIVLAQDPCSYCTKKGRMGADHIEPNCYSGETSVYNLTACCACCNVAKNDRYLLEHLLDEDLFIEARYRMREKLNFPEPEFDLVALAEGNITL